MSRYSAANLPKPKLVGATSALGELALECHTGKAQLQLAELPHWGIAAARLAPER